MTAVDKRKNSSSRSKGSAGARRDLLVISIGALAAFCIAVAFNLFGRAHGWLVSSSPIAADDILAAIVILAVAFGLFSIRTLRRVEREGELREESENRYRAMVERVPAVAYTWDSSDTVGVDPVSYISPQIERLLGYTAEEWAQDPTMWEQRAHPLDREPVLQAWADAATRGVTFTLHGGRAWVEEREGGGASFRVFLPAGPSAAAPPSPNGSGDGADREGRPVGHAEAG